MCSYREKGLVYLAFIYSCIEHPLEMAGITKITYILLKCDAHLRPGGILPHSLDTHLIILLTLAKFL